MDPAPINPLDYKDLVYYLCHRWHVPNPVEDSEEFSEGWIGLMKAAKAFDPTKGVQFITYAYVGIQRGIIATRASRVAAKRGGCGQSGKEKPISTCYLNEEWPTPDHRNRAVGKELENKEYCELLLSKLRPADRKVVKEVVLNDANHRQIARKLGVSRSRVGQQVKQALEQLRKIEEERSLL